MRRGTYSIVARDPASGELGVAVQSHWFSVGSIVCWARAGVGAVATQSIPDPGHGPRALDLMASGRPPEEAIDELLEQDEQARYRQLGAISASGASAAHTGDGCIPQAGQSVGVDHSAQANLMASTEVWPEMSTAFERSAGPLARKLLAALEAAEAAGGDARGRQSAALLVVPGDGEAWEKSVDIRVDDHADPLAELGRLLDVADAYALADEGDALAGAGRHDEAAERYRRAAELQPANHELIFWSGLALAHSGDVAGGADRVARAIELQPGWRGILATLEPEIAPAAAAVRERIGVRE